MQSAETVLGVLRESLESRVLGNGSARSEGGHEERTCVKYLAAWPTLPGPRPPSGHTDRPSPATTSGHRLAPWIEYYNTVRRHSALGGPPPISRL
jgi:transposase InsO family protein